MYFCLFKKTLWKSCSRHLCISFRADTEGVSFLNKPDKVYLNNPNLLYALASGNANIGTLRETFFFNQINHVEEVASADKGDFKINKKTIIEVGGKGKTNEQISYLPNAYLAVDDIEVSFGSKIPLWLFGFLY